MHKFFNIPSSAIFSLLLISGLVSLAGCGASSSNENVVHWQGTVTINGKALPESAKGSITFRPHSQISKPVTVPIVDGRYNSPLTPIGKVTAYFEILKPTGKSYRSDRTGEEIQETENIVPAEKAAGLSFDVNEDKADADIDL